MGLSSGDEDGPGPRTTALRRSISGSRRRLDGLDDRQHHGHSTAPHEARSHGASMRRSVYDADPESGATRRLSGTGSRTSPKISPTRLYTQSPIDLHRASTLQSQGLSHSHSTIRHRSSSHHPHDGDTDLHRTHTLTRIRSTHHTNVSSASGDPELPSQPRPPTPPGPQANAPPPAEEVTVSRLTAHYAGLVLASMVGVLIRLGLTALSTYDGHAVFPLLWSQGVGCGIMGLSLARKSEIAEIYPPIYTFLTTGVAGSVTTFSSWMLESYLAFSNADHYSRGGLYDTVDGVAYCFATGLVSLAAINAGTHFSGVLPRLPTRWLEPPRVDLQPMDNANPEKVQVNVDSARHPEAGHQPNSDTPTSSSATATGNGNGNAVDGTTATSPNDPTSVENGASQPSQNRYGNSPASDLEADEEETLPDRRNPLSGATPFLDCFFIASAFLSYLVALLVYFLGPKAWRHKALFPMLLAPPGAILRFALGRINVRSMFIDRFPMGTFIANMVATLVLCGSYVASYDYGGGGGVGRIRCDALWAIQQGFCGCLSTVSTFAVEARAIKGRRWKWIYVGGSVVLGHLFALAIIGGTRWSKGQGVICEG